MGVAAKAGAWDKSDRKTGGQYDGYTLTEKATKRGKTFDLES